MPATIKGSFLLAIAYLFIAIATEWGANTLAVWPAAGISLAGLMILGTKVWPGIWLGSFCAVLLHFTLNDESLTSKYILIAFLTASGNALAAILANKLSPSSFFDQDNTEQFSLRAGRYLLAAGCIGFVSAIFGIGSYYLVGIHFEDGFINYLLGWAIADIVGVITLTPFCYLLFVHRNNVLDSLQSGESKVILLICLIIGFFISGPGYTYIPKAFAQPSLLFIPLIWAVLRKPALAVAILNLLTFLIMWWGTTLDYGYFSVSFGSGALTAMQVVLCCTLLPIQLLEVLLIQRKNELMSQNRVLEQRVKERTESLEKAKTEAEILARTDPMTGLNNRRAFFSLGAQIEKIAKRHNRPFCVLMIDIDHFKRVNDTYGHDIGDKTIISLTDAILETIRDSDIAGRLGGEEFAIIIPDASKKEGLGLATRIQRNIAKILVDTPKGAFNFTVSIGISSKINNSDTLEIILKQSDNALYEAKNNGRNCIKCIDTSNPPAP